LKTGKFLRVEREKKNAVAADADPKDKKEKAGGWVA
jgi:hypothetical protein